MSSPRLIEASRSTRTEREVRNERAIASRLIAMRAEGFSERDLQREAALMRGASNVIGIFENIGSGIK